ncbi:MAG: DUF3494 domain-containing protein, partial [Thermoplasmata archaeon]|nr:DUF3494 domain-containing protein [Thermoplasmata archaeon]
MSTKPKKLGVLALVVMVSFGMLLAALGAATQFTPATPGASVARTHLSTAASGPAAVNLGSASTYAAIAYASITNTGTTALTGDIGISPGSALTGFPPGTYSGTKNVANSAAATAMADVTTAYNDAAGRT